MSRSRFAAFAALTVLVIGGTARADSGGLFDYLLGFSAKETCSCAFVVEQTDDYCKAFGQAAGLSTQVAIDRSGRSVSATFQGVTRTARADASGACSMDDVK